MSQYNRKHVIESIARQQMCDKNSEMSLCHHVTCEECESHLHGYGYLLYLRIFTGSECSSALIGLCLIPSIQHANSCPLMLMSLIALMTIRKWDNIREASIIICAPHNTLLTTDVDMIKTTVKCHHGNM